MVDMGLAIEGIGVTCAAGCGIESLMATVRDGISPPLTAVETTPGEGMGAAEVFRAHVEGLEEFFAKKELRRIDHYAKMGLLAASLAMKDARTGPERDRLKTGIVVATGYGPHCTTFGFLDSFMKGENAFPSPTQFASSVHNAAAAYAAILLKESGPSLTVSQFEMSVASALLTASCWLEEERVKTVLFGAVDEYSDVLGYCWDRYFGTPRTGRAKMEPLDFEKESGIPGEGSVFLVLSKDKDRARYGFIRGAEMGFIGPGKPSLSDKGLLFLGADGMRETGRLYAPFAAGRRDLICCSPAYGSLPTGQAFDMAIAACRIGTGWGSPTDPEGGREEETIECLKIGRQREFGVVTVAR